jgi:hypothetical protein
MLKLQLKFLVNITNNTPCYLKQLQLNKNIEQVPSYD